MGDSGEVLGGDGSARRAVEESERALEGHRPRRRADHAPLGVALPFHAGIEGRPGETDGTMATAAGVV